MTVDREPRVAGRLPLLSLSVGHGCADLDAGAVLAVVAALVPVVAATGVALAGPGGRAPARDLVTLGVGHLVTGPAGGGG